MISSQSGSLSLVGRVRSSIKSKGADASIEAKVVYHETQNRFCKCNMHDFI